MEYRIEQLARAAGVAVDTIRFYQGEGLLDAPRREGRVTFYGDAHVERLKRIKELQQQGFTLTVIQRFLAGELEASDEALVAAVTHPAAPQTLTLGELAERSGVAEPLLASLEQAGLLVPITGGEEPLYPADDLEAIAAGMKLISAGVPLGALMELGKDHAAAVDRTARQAVDLFDRHVRERIQAEGGETEAVSVAAIGRAFDIVASPGGVSLEDEAGRTIEEETDDNGNRILAAARLWQRVAPAEGAIAVGGFAYRPDRDPGGAWSGFPALLIRVPALAVMRRRGRTFVTAATPDAEALLDIGSTAVRAPGARTLSITPLRNPLAWTAAVESAAARLRGGEAEKVVLAREVLARGDGVVSAGMVVRGLRAAYPSCFTYLIAGADGTAFAGASPELLIRRSGNHAFSQPMAGSVARGATDAEDDRLARQLSLSAKDMSEHRLVSKFVMDALHPFSSAVSAREPEVARFTNIQHLATSVQAELSDPPADVLTLAAALHPTPAVGGWPGAAADGLIDELDGMERGWSAAGAA